VLAAFFLGRYRAGILALFSMMAASVVSVADLTGFSSYNSPVVIALSVTVWGAVLGLTAILVGTLSDDRAAKMLELHEAYVGVVEVLARYLQSANPRLKDRSVRVATGRSRGTLHAIVGKGNRRHSRGVPAAGHGEHRNHGPRRAQGHG
jgi:hypothetical protein